MYEEVLKNSHLDPIPQIPISITKHLCKELFCNTQFFNFISAI